MSVRMLHKIRVYVVALCVIMSLNAARAANANLDLVGKRLLYGIHRHLFIFGINVHPKYANGHSKFQAFFYPVSRNNENGTRVQGVTGITELVPALGKGLCII